MTLIGDIMNSTVSINQRKNIAFSFFGIFRHLQKNQAF